MRKVTMSAFIFITFTILALILKDTTLAGSLPDTGQTKCYGDTQEITCPQPGESFYGQDAQYPCNPQSYTKLDESGIELLDTATSWVMVRDNITGLIWEVKQNKDGVPDYNNHHDADNNYTWYDSNSDTNGSYAGTPGVETDTEDFINALNNAQFGGYDDWRLPTVKELSLILNNDTYPAINTNYFPNTATSSCCARYWSSTTAHHITIFAWDVHFYGATVSHVNKSNNNYVRAVRGGQTSNNFIDNGDGTVTDINTSLMWQQATAPGTYTWEQALAYCEDLILNNDGEFTIGDSNTSGIKYNDWSLPDRNELHSLSDYSTHYPVINTEYFPDTITNDYWSSTTSPYIANYAFRVYFNYGIVGKSPSKYGYYYVRCVRDAIIDSDGDGIPDDGDNSGSSSDTPCTDGNTVSCDDNCIDTPNTNQDDADNDTIGDVCDDCTDTDGDGYGNPDYAANTCALDNCPDEDSSGFDADENGCIDSLSNLPDVISTLVEEGVISEELENSITTKVENALKSTDKDNICTAVNQLEAFKNQIEAQRDNKISDEAADLLINYADNLITQLLNDLPVGESC